MTRGGYGCDEKETNITLIKYNKNEGKGSVGYNVNRCVDSLHLNSDRDFKHIMSYGREFQYFGAITEKADVYM